MEKDKEIIKNIFRNSTLFEKEILHAVSDNDRSDIMKILAAHLVRDVLKEHINFLYVKDLEDFTLKQIVNILFKEIANEWISYAMDTLHYPKEKALVELQPKERVKLIHSIALTYYREYKSYIFEEIADTFIELVASISHSSERALLVNEVINSKLIANRTVLGINNFDQLHRKVKSAKNSKNSDVSSIQMKIADIIKDINSPDTSDEERERLLIVLPKFENKAEKTVAMKLENFDASLQRVKRAIVNSLNSGIYNH